jgi:AcrR family transcriptional regulator
VSNAETTRANDTPPEELSPTAARIFLAAERLFAERGFEGVSVRDIVAEAEVNLAAVSYHFGSKSELLLAVFRARTKQLNRERREGLRAAEAQHDGAPLEAIVRALLGPPILWRDPSSGKDTASRFISRVLSEATPELRKILETDVSHLQRFLAPLARAMPGCSEAEACWALHFVVGLPHQCTDTNFKRLDALSGGRCDTQNAGGALERAVSFALGGVGALQARTAHSHHQAGA